LSCLCVVLMACGTAFAQQGERMMSGPYKGPLGPILAPEAPDAGPFYSNLLADPCNAGFMYSAANGYFVLGPNNCFAAGSTQWISYPFIAKKTGNVRNVKLALTNYGVCTATSTKVTVAIYSDNCTGVPITQIGNAVIATVGAAPPALATANFGATGPALTVGTTYWVVVTTSTAATQTGTTAVWWQTTLSTQGYNLDDTTGWHSAPLGGPGAFSVN
jgi:hypothetical protein